MSLREAKMEKLDDKLASLETPPVEEPKKVKKSKKKDK